MSFDCIVIRESMLLDNYVANLWEKHNPNVEVIRTKPITTMDEELLKQISGKNLLIVGGYYRNNMQAIIEVAEKVTVFADDSLSNINYDMILPDEEKSFGSWSLQKLEINDPHICKIIQYLEEYIHGYPTEETIKFHYGLYSLEGSSDTANLAKLVNNKTQVDIDNIIQLGNIIYQYNRRNVTLRANHAKNYNFNGNDVLVAIADSPIIDTCLYLSEISTNGLAVIIRYDLKSNKTFFSARSTRESGIHCGDFMSKLVGGGGSKAMGGGSMTGFMSPENIFNP